MQTRKSGNQPSGTGGGGNPWQSTTLGALSRQQKGGNAQKAQKGGSEGKPQTSTSVGGITSKKEGNQAEVSRQVNAATASHKHATEGMEASKKTQESQSKGSVGNINQGHSVNKDGKGGIGLAANGVRYSSNNLRQSQPNNPQSVRGNTHSKEPHSKQSNGGLTQIQTHSGTGPQQNLFIKNLFFIHSGSRNNSALLGENSGAESGSTTRNHNGGGQRQGGKTQIFESAPVTSKGIQEIDGQFTEAMAANQKANEGYQYGLSSPLKSGRYQLMTDGKRESSQKAIDIATTVLQHLAPTLTSPKSQIKVTPSTDVQNGSKSLAKAMKQTKALDGPLTLNAKTQQHPKSVSPNKRTQFGNTKEKVKTLRSSESDGEFDQAVYTEVQDVDESVVFFSNIQKGQGKDIGPPKKYSEYQLSPEESNKAQTECVTYEEVSNNRQAKEASKSKKPSYGEMPKYTKSKTASNPPHNHLQYGSSTQLQAMSPQNQDITKRKGTNSSQLKVGPHSRNINSDVFSYKGKTVNIAERPAAIILGTTRNVDTTSYPKNQLSSLIDGISERNSVKERNHSKDSKPISKSQSQQHINVQKRGKNTSESQIYDKADAIYMSIGNISLKQPIKSSQIQDSWNGETSNMRYESGIMGDKQSELSSNNDNRDDRQSIRVMARFRPYNNIENEIQELYSQKGSVVEFNDDKKTIRLVEEFHTQSSNLNFTFDHIFNPDTTQSEIFEKVGSQMIEDIMYGYNGTIFAYGQTGSGKTFTMYGDDIFDEDKMGLIPRAARQIFDHIRRQDLEVEYTIRVQMIEIYKETLRDLLHNSSERAPDLKIKEDPKRGTYVEGLQDICIVNEEEIMTVICTGETMRHVACTQMNQVSSRSHAICMIEIVSKYPNDSERRGVLNLVDLAGSERVSKSMAQGPALEEAKKINFSLSMLGKVINSLTKNSPHIPYRDSKLTRLLKESLGGNNKTSLIVACSMHHSNFEETLSSLRFAQSAKFIKNKVKLNIKTSNQQLQMMIEQLKIELRCAKEEIQRLQICSGSQSQLIPNDLKEATKVISQEQESDDDHSAYRPVSVKSVGNFQANSSTIPQPPLQAIHNLPHQSLLAKNYEIIETNNQQSVQLLSLIAQDLSLLHLATNHQSQPQFYTSPNKLHTSSSVAKLLHPQQLCMDPMHHKMLQKLASTTDELEMKLRSKEQDLEATTFQKDELLLKVSNLEEKVNGYKHKLLALEKKVTEQESEKDFLFGKEVTQTHKMRHLENTIKSLDQQVKDMEKALEESEQRCSALARERQEWAHKKAQEMFEETFKVLSIPMSASIEKLLNKSREDVEDLHSEVEILPKDDENYASISLRQRDLLMKNLYSLEMHNQNEGNLTPDVSIYLLKNQLIEVCMANHNLQRYLSISRWKYHSILTKFRVKEDLCKNQEETIGTLEDVLERTKRTHEKLKQRVDKLENQVNQNQRTHQHQADMVLWNDACSNGGSNGEGLTQRAGTMQYFETMNRSTVNPLNAAHTQSIMSGSMHGNTIGQPIINSKTRFTRTINSKVVRKMFNSKLEATPGSRPSLGAGGMSGTVRMQSQSIISQYYGLKTNLFGTHKAQLSQIDSNTAGGSGTSSNQQTRPKKIVAAIEHDEDFQREDEVVIQEANEYQEQSSKDNKSQAKRERAVSAGVNTHVELTVEELKQIDNSGSLQEVKDYLRIKFSQVIKKAGSKPKKAKNEAREIYSAERKVSRSHSSPGGGQEGQRIETITCGSGLYKVSETSEIQRENEILAAIPTTTHHHFETSASQDGPQMPKGNEALTLTLDSGGMTSVVLGPYPIGNLMGGNGGATCNAGLGGGFLTRSHQFQQQHFFGTAFCQPADIIDRLQEKLILAQDEADTQRNRADELKKLCQDNKKQISSLREQLEAKEAKFGDMIKDEVFQWEQAVSQLKRLNDQEIQKKQREVDKLNELLAKWIESYQKAEKKNRGAADNASEMETLVAETMKHNKNANNQMLTEVLLSPTPQNRQGQSLSFAAFRGEPGSTKVPIQMVNIKSPNTQYFMQTPQTKGVTIYQPVHTHHQMRPTHHVLSSMIIPNPPLLNLATQQSCTSPVMNLLMSEKQDHVDIRGDESPPLHQQNSSFDEEEEGLEDDGEALISEQNQSTSLLERLPLDMIDQSPPKKVAQNRRDSIRMTKTRLQQLSQVSIPSDKMAHSLLSHGRGEERKSGISKRKTFVVPEPHNQSNQSSSQLEWNLHSQTQYPESEMMLSRGSKNSRTLISKS